MKIQARQKLANGELGRRFWITGTVEAPMVGTIYDREKNATDFTREEVAHLIDTYGNVLEFERV